MAPVGVPDITSRGDIRSILIVRLHALGDIVLTLPLVREMRRVFPRAWIGYLCRARYAEALGGATGLDEVLALEPGIRAQARMTRRLRRAGIDLALDLLGSPRSALITLLSGAGTRVGMDTGRHNWCYHSLLPRSFERDGRRFKCYTAEANLMLGAMLGLDARTSAAAPVCDGQGDAGRPFGFPAAVSEREWAASFVSRLEDPGCGFAALVPGSTYPAKSWPVERFVDLARVLVDEMRLRPVVICGPGEEEIARAIEDRASGAVVPPPTGIARAGALIERMRVVIGVDSGLKHLAVLLGVPTVTLFGPTDPAIWDPRQGPHRAVCRRLECAEGCRQHFCRPNSCMELITVAEVAATVAGLLEAHEPYSPARQGRGEP